MPLARFRLSTRCALCADWSTQPLCGLCLARFAPAKPRCHGCGLVTPVGVVRCGACLLAPPPYARTVVAVDYAPPWTRLIQAFKFQERCDLAVPLASLLAQRLQACDASADLVLALPLHPQRLRGRGFNQSWLLAQALGHRLGLPATAQALIRWRETERQVALDQSARQRNLRGAFMPDPLHGARLKGKHIALVDDVMTTGATCSAACSAVLEAGAASVSLWLLARTPQPGHGTVDNIAHVSHRPGSP